MNFPFPPKRRRTRLLAGLAGLVCALVFLAGCRTETEQKWLNVFFDGVPQPGATNAAARNNGVLIAKLAVVTNTPVVAVKGVVRSPSATARRATSLSSRSPCAASPARCVSTATRS
jgi:hypothetical protein